ncbi:uncharacterized protein Nmag_1368 [Natrialba magadii ATCC 43099]|uniref:Uncharacterized protein n=1 Tax=Natrialba magadii (strain ATCC 43099 / DSM 3394 / CCM 3739 / CIP 104546 / IAM 13178 / JCM 8861 / NBRC 102185 / NCIMB 2190 / MS3) TaxID=547559 RepID=D3ST01_NATMM|nr:hypothetical protein [Natrialba magadii]ADD04947.1 uncharacterized protein Nmag_1368 [Natrialba magadii ATCC 43099]ELY23995.1 hypothetical protein C500_19365 [Natrialba magadii ATCC 43099]
MAAGFAFILILFVGLAFTVGLYLLIADETSNPTVMDREQAEAEAKRRGGLNGEQHRTQPRERIQSPHSERAERNDDRNNPRTGTDEPRNGWEFERDP